MLEVFSKKYRGKVNTDVTYYFAINTRGVRRYYQTIYESISDISYEYSRYDVSLKTGEINVERIENDVYRFTPILFLKIKAQRRLAIFSKFALYIISENTGIPIYKLVEKVSYYHDGDEITLSTNSFIKNTYALIPRFEKVYRPE